MEAVPPYFHFRYSSSSKHFIFDIIPSLYLNIKIIDHIFCAPYICILLLVFIYTALVRPLMVLHVQSVKCSTIALEQ